MPPTAATTTDPTDPATIETQIESLVADLKKAVDAEVAARTGAAQAQSDSDAAAAAVAKAQQDLVTATAAVATAQSQNTAALQAIKDYVTEVLTAPANAAPPAPSPASPAVNGGAS